ncbi:hypothetical protein AX16_001003 [Volvariella volvacea WC 439]|nr:hypothetical protein AX16_001003 [Volvariella volvacea WC 439]
MNDQADEHPGFRPPTPQSDAPFDPHVGLANDSGYGHDLSGSEGDPELDALLRENSEIDSSSSEEGEVTNAPNPKTKRYRTSWFESPTCTLAILVVSCWILRIPILYCDLVKEIEIYRIPYLDALRLLPENMISHLNKYCVMTLSPHFAPTVIQMHRYSSRLAKVMFKVFGVMTPEANAAPILWRCVRSTGGTPIVYCIAKELARILSVPMALHHSLTPKLQRKRANDPERRVHDNIPPELSLQCCVLIVLKMMYGFDGHARLPTDSSDPVNLLPGIEEFLSLLREDEDEKDAFHSRNASMIVGDLDSHQLDAYLDFCERVLLQEGIEPDAEISRYFPLTQNNVPEWGTSSKNKPEKITAKAPGTSALSPGAGYQMYHGRDILGTFPEEYGIVLERAGRNVGVEVGYVNGVMETYERRLMAWWQMEKRQATVFRTFLVSARDGDLRGPSYSLPLPPPPVPFPFTNPAVSLCKSQISPASPSLLATTSFSSAISNVCLINSHRPPLLLHPFLSLMRRFVAVFAKKRDRADSQPPPSTPPSSQPPSLSLVASLRRKAKRTERSDALSPGVSSTTSSTPSTPQLSSGSASTAPSSVSSGASATGSLQTLDEDLPQHSTPAKRPWKALLHRQTKDSSLPSHSGPDSKGEWNIPDWSNDHRNAPILHSPPARSAVKARNQDSHHASPAQPVNRPSSTIHSSTPPAQPRRSAPTNSVSASEYLAVIVRNSLVPQLHSSPFTHRHGKPCFPRSCNPPRGLPYSEPLRINVQRKHLLRRLESPVGTWTQSEMRSIRPLEGRPPPTLVEPVFPSHDEMAPSQIGHISLHSTGLQRWIARPCFEDRYDSIIVVDGQAVHQQVSGPALAVAALEVSEAVEAMALSDSLQDQLTALTSSTSSPLQSPDLIEKAPSLSLSPRGTPHPINPSPLRNEHPFPPTESTKPAAATTNPPNSMKRGVRFAEDDKEDVIPLGYVLRMKQRREAKAKFLKQEQEKRELVERLRGEHEQKRQEQLQVAQKQDLERKELLEDRKRREEERRQRQYTEEVVAARLRREAQRAGGVPALINANSHNPNPPPIPSSASTSSLWESERNRPRDSRRPAYETRKEGSEMSIPSIYIPNSASPYDSSPGSSQRSSMVDHSPVTPASVRGVSLGYSRPTSIYSSYTQSSSEDVRHRDRSKRNSFASVTARTDYMTPHSIWTGSNPSMVPVPQYMMDMPLLPPTAPFMLHQYPRQRSPGRSSSGSSRSRAHTYSTVDGTYQWQSSSPHRPEFHSSSSSLSSSNRHPESRPSHHRRHSGDSRRSSAPIDHSRGSSSRPQTSTLPRGRSTMPSPLQTPNPWTALPTQAGYLPTAMPAYGIIKDANSSKRG